MQSLAAGETIMIATIVLAANLFLAAFGGTWTCAVTLPGNAHPVVTHWQMSAIRASTWTAVRWQADATGGTAYVGYIAPDRHWVYQDFHDDGSYGASTSEGPHHGVWTWPGVFATSQRVLHGASQWRIVDGRLRRGFGALVGTSFRESAHDTCTRA
jgi:hypothetical protein